MVLNRGDFYPLEGTLGNIQRRFGFHSLGLGCHWHLVGRGQGCSSTPYNAQESPQTQHYPAPNVNIAEVENPGLGNPVL